MEKGEKGKAYLVEYLEESVVYGIDGKRKLVWRMKWWQRPYYAIKNFIRKHHQ